MTASPAEIEKFLSDRLEVVRSERAATREAFNALDAKIKALKKNLGTSPRDSLEAITSQITALEREHSRSSHGQAAERTFMFEIDKLKQKKKAAAAFSKQNAEVEALKTQLATLRNQLLEKETAMEELNAGLKKVKIASKVRVSNSEVVDKVYRVADIAQALADAHGQTLSREELVDEVEHCIAKIIGKNGSSIKHLEDAFNVDVTVNNADQTLAILGTLEDILRAYEQIYLLCDNLTVELSVTEECIAYLTNNKFDLINELGTKHGVKIDVFQLKNHLKINGLTNQVRAAESDLKIINKNIIRSDILLEANYFAFIIGKAGANIRAVESSHHVICKIDKDANRLAVIGMKTNVLSASEDIKNNIHDNKEAEVAVPCEKHVFLGAFIGSNGGQMLRNITKEFGVRVDTDSKEGTTEAKDYTLKVKGHNSKVLAAVEHVRAVIDTYNKQTAAIQVSEDIMPLLLGKGGANIKSLRERYPSANIDINGQTVYIHSDDSDVRESVENDVNALIDVNYSTTIELSDVNLSLFLKLRFYNQRLKSECGKQGVALFVSRKLGNVKLRGPQENVEKGAKVIRDYVGTFATEDLDVGAEDFNLFIKPLSPAPAASEDAKDVSPMTILRCIEELYDVDLNVDRKATGDKATVRFSIRGVGSQTQQAVAHIRGILGGDARYHSTLLPVHRLIIPAIIGKAGANVKKIEQDYNVIVDYNKANAVVRIYGHDSASREAVKSLISSYAYQQRVTETFVVTKDHVILEGPEAADEDDKVETKRDEKKDRDEGHKRLGSPLLDAVVKKSMDVFKVDIERLPAGANVKLVLRGYLPLLAEVRNFFNLFFAAPRHLFKLHLLPEHILKFKALKLPKNLEVFQSKYRAQVTLDEAENYIGFRYPSAAVAGSALPVGANAVEHVHAVLEKQSIVRQAFLKNVHSLFPGQTAFLEANRAFIFDHLTPRQAAGPHGPHYHNLFMHLHGLQTSLSLEYAKGIIFICAADLSAAIGYIDSLLVEWNQRNCCLTVPSLTVLQLLVSKQHVHNLSGIISKLNLAGVADLNLDRLAMTLAVHMLKADAAAPTEKEEGEVVQSLEAVAAEVQKILDSLQREHREIAVANTEVLPVFIGKQGGHINALRTEFGINIDIDDKSKSIRITGPEDKVAEAAAKIEAFLANELANLQITRVFQLPNAAIIPALIGAKGARIKAVEEGCEVRCDIDKVRKRVSIRGKEPGLEKALTEFNAFLTEEGHPAVTFIQPSQSPIPSSSDEEEAESTNEKEDKPEGPRVIPGSLPNVMTSIAVATAGKQLSKSAQRRLRRKIATLEGEEEGGEEVEAQSAAAPAVVEAAKASEPEAPVVIAPAPAPVLLAAKAVTPAPAVAPPAAAVAPIVVVKPIVTAAPALTPAVPTPAAVLPIGSGILSRGPPAKPSTLPAAPGLPTPTNTYKQSDLLALLLGDDPMPSSVPGAKPASLEFASYSQFGGHSGAFASDASVLSGTATASAATPPPGLDGGNGASKSGANYYKSKSGLTVRL